MCFVCWHVIQVETKTFTPLHMFSPSTCETAKNFAVHPRGHPQEWHEIPAKKEV